MVDYQVSGISVTNAGLIPLNPEISQKDKVVRKIQNESLHC